jgi:hypothetical protein
MNVLMRAILLTLIIALPAGAQTTEPFDGRPWNISTGNLSVNYIQASPIGSHPRPLEFDPPPSHEQLVWDKQHGLVAYEDYIAWGAVEREPGKWDFSQHDKIEKAIHAAGLKYVVYDWVHFPPVWLRDQQKDKRTLMRCLEHGKETNYLSIFDPKTIEWYDHFYKAVHDHFGNRIDGIYACILGPYGEGNYPLNVPDWINIGHCHEGYWCADPYALKAFSSAMEKRYAGDIGALNRAWGSHYTGFDAVHPPDEIVDPGFKPSPNVFQFPDQRHRWVDFITWYHQAIIDFAGKSIQTTLKYFPKEKVRLKPGGNAGGVNPIAWGTYCPGYAKMAARFDDSTPTLALPRRTGGGDKGIPAAPSSGTPGDWGGGLPRGIVLQPADWRGAYFGDKWVATAYHFYGVTLSTEPAGGMDHHAFLLSLFSDAACGARQLFTYDFPTHGADIEKYAHLITGQPGETQVAILCPTTLYRLGGDLSPTINFARQFRDLSDYDVLDELLVADGALTTDKYKAMIVYQGDFIDQPILDKMEAYLHAGGTILLAGSDPPANLDGQVWKPKLDPEKDGKLIYCGHRLIERFKRFAQSHHLKGYDGKQDGVWTCRRGDVMFMLNRTDKAVKVGETSIAPRELSEANTAHKPLERVQVSADHKGFVLANSHQQFTPWGFNYDRNDQKGLLESYWRDEWDRVVSDFGKMKALGANIVRIHLQFSAFMDGPDKPDEANFRQLEKLVALAEQTGLYLDLTGLACYRKQDVPAWYDAMDESQRWDAQARFWEEVARRCNGHNAVMFYDLMNEPIVPGSKQPKGQWLVPIPFGGYYFVQYITLDPAGRRREEIAGQWMRCLVGAIRKHDHDTLISVGLLPNSLPGPGFTSGFTPAGAAKVLDFLCVHEYPRSGNIDDSIALLKKFNVGKPLLVEETFPLNASLDDMSKFLTRARPLTAGCTSFFWGRTPRELKASTRMSDAITAGWIERFMQLKPEPAH